MKLELKNISKTFNKKTENEVNALSDVSVDFYPNEWTYIIGGNGSGKSTLLNAISGELKIDAGHISFHSCSLNDICFVEQITSKNLIPSMSIYENLVFGLKQDGMCFNLNPYRQKKYKERIVRILSDFNLGLEYRLNEQVRFLSGGEQQIIVASRILLSNPKILLMDEFTSALDQKWSSFILKKLKDYAEKNKTMILAVTHDYSQIENIGNRLVMMKNGSIIADMKDNSFNFNTRSILNLFYEK
jgi:putative ABC transport system ATP-binding protein